MLLFEHNMFFRYKKKRTSSPWRQFMHIFIFWTNVMLVHVWDIYSWQNSPTKTVARKYNLNNIKNVKHWLVQSVEI